MQARSSTASGRRLPEAALADTAASHDDVGEPPGCAAKVRWAILSLACGGLFGQFYAFDIPSALNVQMRNASMISGDMTEAEFQYKFGMLYSVYSVPSVILPLSLGFAVDRFGAQALIVCLSFIVVLGQIVFARGYGLEIWPMMFVGRAILGIGAESLHVAQNCLLFRWFRGREVALALGLNLSAARSGSVLNGVLSPWFARRHGVEGTLWFGAALCFSSFICNSLSVLLDRRMAEVANVSEAVNTEDFSAHEVLKMPRLFWLSAALCVVFYCGILPFNNIASAFFVDTQFNHLPPAEAQQRAGIAIALLYLVSAVGTPAFGGLTDMIGHRTHFLFFSAVLLAATHFCIFMLPPEVTMFSLGCVYMIFAGALSPSFALTVPQKQLGTAYGVAISLQNLGLAAVPMWVAHLQATSPPGDYHRVVLLFIVIGIVGIKAALLLHMSNASCGGVLDLPSDEAEAVLACDERAPLQAASEAAFHKVVAPGEASCAP